MHGRSPIDVAALVSPSQWTVRTRTTVAATVVVTLCLMLAGVPY
jgi:hypothetical protein